MNTYRKNQKKDGKTGHLNFAVPKNNITFENFGWQKCDGTETGGNLRRRNYSIYVILGGNGYYNVGRAKYRLSEQDIFLVKPEETVSFYPDARNPWEYVYVSFPTEGAEDFLKRLGLENSLIGSINSVETIKYLLEKIQRLTAGKSYAEYSFTGYVYEIIGEIVKNKTETTFSTENSKKLISEAVNYVASNFGDNITVSEMSKYLCIERTTLFRLFKDSFGISPQKYIISYKLKTAKELIENTNNSLILIAQKCGFQNYSHFSRSFTSFYGYSPTKLRETEK